MRFALVLWFACLGLAHAEEVSLNFDLKANVPLAHVMRSGPVAIQRWSLPKRRTIESPSATPSVA